MLVDTILNFLAILLLKSYPTVDKTKLIYYSSKEIFIDSTLFQIIVHNTIWYPRQLQYSKRLVLNHVETSNLISPPLDSFGTVYQHKYGHRTLKYRMQHDEYVANVANTVFIALDITKYSNASVIYVTQADNNYVFVN